MTITIALADADDATDVLAVHDRLPPGLSTADNEVGWRMPLAKLAALVEAGYSCAADVRIGNYTFRWKPGCALAVIRL